MSLLRGLTGIPAELRAATTPTIPDRSTGSWAGQSVNGETALRHSTVYSCINLIADSLAMLPVQDFVGNGPEREPLREQPLVLDEPFPGIEWLDWLHQGLVSLLMRGNHYAMVTGRDDLGFPTELMPLHPLAVTPLRTDDGRVKYRLTGERDLFPRSEIFHVKGLTIPGAVAGVSPIEYAANTIGVSLAAAEFASKLFADGGTPSSILKTDKKLTIQEARDYQQLWLEMHGGNRRKPAVMGSGLEWQAVSLNPNEAQFLETRAFSRSELCGFYRVPPHMVADVAPSTSWGSGIEEQGLMYVTFTMGPWIARYERALRRIRPKGEYVKFNVAALLRARTLEQYQAFTLARAGGWMNIDDVRALIDKPPLPDGKGQDYLQALNYEAIPPGGLVADVIPPPDQAPPGVTADSK